MLLAVPCRLQPADPGTRSGWLTSLVVVITVFVVAVLLRYQAARRTRRLPDLVAAEGAQWGALGRVLAGGRFLDRGRGRRGGGPRGTLLSVGDTLQWCPDRWETRHGDQPFSWSSRQVRCLARARHRDITGAGYDRVELALPDGPVVFGLFAEYGRSPASLDGEPRLPWSTS